MIEEDLLSVGGSEATVSGFTVHPPAIAWLRAISPFPSSRLYLGERYSPDNKSTFDYSVYISDSLAEIVVFQDGLWVTTETWNCKSIGGARDALVLDGVEASLKKDGYY